MDFFSPINPQEKALLSLDQGKLRALSDRFHNHETPQELMKTAKDFEGIFVKQLLAEMDKTIDRAGLFDGGTGEETFRGMLYDKMAESIATRPGGSGLGLAEAIYRQLASQLPTTLPQPATDSAANSEKTP